MSDKPTIRMQLFYYRNKWQWFWKPAIKKQVSKATPLLPKLPTLSLHPSVGYFFKEVYCCRQKITAFICATAFMWIPVFAVTTSAPTTAGEYSAPDQTVTSGVGEARAYRDGLYTPQFIYPVGNVEIASPYGWRNAPCVGCSSEHNGTDFHVPAGTPVQAAMTGTVVFTGWQGSFGYLMVIDAGYGYVTYYAHMIDGSIPSKFVLGSRVNMGDVIGLVGCTGACTGAHLHFGVQEDGVFVDPMPLLQKYAS
jgi:murein DD-endopeptidase MepM/ murein hydrolase activator NlpD